MSDEQRKEETEVEAHGAYPPKYGANDEPGDEVEGHGRRVGANDEPTKDEEVEGHGRRVGANDEPTKDETEVEAHGAYPPKYGANDEPSEDDEVEGHVRRVN